MNKGYFVVNLVDGTYLNLDRRCNNISYEDSNLCIFREKMDDGSYLVLAMIPYDRINYIGNVIEEVQQ